MNNDENLLTQYRRLQESVKDQFIQGVRRYVRREIVNMVEDIGLLWTPLHWAAEGGVVEIVQILIENGADPNLATKWGRTSLHMAAFNGHEKVVMFLILNGADIERIDQYDDTALNMARDRGFYNCVRLIEEAVVEKNRLKRLPWNIVCQDDLVEFQNCLFPTNYLSSRDPITGLLSVNILLEDGPGKGGIRSEKKILDFLLREPVTQEELVIFQEMQNQNPNTELTKTREFLFYRALKHGSITAVENCYDLDLINAATLLGRKSALQLVMEHGSTTLVSFVLLGIIDETCIGLDWGSVEDKVQAVVQTRLGHLRDWRQEGMTRLEIAVLDNRSDVVDFILGSHPLPCQSRSSIDRAACASLDRNNRCFFSLVKSGFRLDYVNEFSQTLLHLAIARKMLQESLYLTENSPLEILQHRDLMGYAAIHRAVQARFHNVTDLLVSKMGQSWNLPVQVEGRSCNQWSETTLSLCVRAGFDGGAGSIEQWEAVWQAVSGEEVVHRVDEEGNTVLHLLAKMGYEMRPVLAQLASAAVAIGRLDEANEAGDTALGVLVRRMVLNVEVTTESLDYLRVLLDEGADINAVGSQGHSVFQAALQSDEEGLVFALLSRRVGPVPVTGAEILTSLIAKHFSVCLLQILQCPDPITASALVSTASSSRKSPLQMVIEQEPLWRLILPPMLLLIDWLGDNATPFLWRLSDGIFQQRQQEPGYDWSELRQIIMGLVERGADIRRVDPLTRRSCVATFQDDQDFQHTLEETANRVADHRRENGFEQARTTEDESEDTASFSIRLMSLTED